jgi:hypothetical protein
MMAGQAGMSFLGNSRQASAQNRIAAKNRQEAETAYHSEQAAINAQNVREGTIFREQNTDTVLEAARAQGAARASQAGNGSTGQSYQELLRGYAVARDTALGRNNNNYTQTVANSDNDKVASYNKLRQRYAQNQNVAKPSLLEAVMPVAGQAFMNKYKLGGD